MNKITESEIEQFAIEMLESFDYKYCFGPDIAPDAEYREWDLFEDLVLIKRNSIK